MHVLQHGNDQLMAKKQEKYDTRASVDDSSSPQG
jgi:hypothetical protein